MYLASGTDDADTKAEAALLDIARYFDGIHGALDDYRSFSKRVLIERLLADPGVRGEMMLAFGDGYVEIEEVKRAGGLAVGVATDEPECAVTNDWKRRRLIAAGADCIIANYLHLGNVLETLFS